MRSRLCAVSQRPEEYGVARRRHGADAICRGDTLSGCPSSPEAVCELPIASMAHMGHGKSLPLEQGTASAAH